MRPDDVKEKLCKTFESIKDKADIQNCRRNNIAIYELYK